MDMKYMGVIAALIIGGGLILAGKPSLEKKSADQQSLADNQLKAREVQISPIELLNQIYNFNTALRIIDVRNEADYNLFHIVDAVHVDMSQINTPQWVKTLPKETVLVLVSNNENRATSAWKTLAVQGVKNLYILEGGVNYWLDLFGSDTPVPHDKQPPAPMRSHDDRLRHSFSFALGDRHPAADPDIAHITGIQYDKKIKPIGRAPKKSGGCG